MHEAGRDVPGEVSIVGFDDIPEAQFFTPPLTTVHQDFNEVGRQSLLLLLEEIEARRAVDPAGRRAAGVEDPREHGAACMSRLVFGTYDVPEPGLLDRFVARGGRALDVANVYRDGESARAVGRWLRGGADVALYAKGCHPPHCAPDLVAAGDRRRPVAAGGGPARRVPAAPRRPVAAGGGLGGRLAGAGRRGDDRRVRRVQLDGGPAARAAPRGRRRAAARVQQPLLARRHGLPALAGLPGRDGDASCVRWRVWA